MSPIALALRSASSSSAVAGPRGTRRCVATHATAESTRRAVLGSFLVGAAALAGNTGSALAAATPIDIFDDTKAKKLGYDIIYEARDLELPQNVRDGLTQARTNLDDTRKRIKAAEFQIKTSIEPAISRGYWTLAREELRLRAGTLRFDLDALAAPKAKTKDARLAMKAAKKDFIAKVEALDLALRVKNKDKSLQGLKSTQTALDTVLAMVL